MSKYKIIFGNFPSYSEHPGYLYLKNEARQEGWSGTDGIKGMIEERWGKNARLYLRDGYLYGIGFKNSEEYNEFLMKSGCNQQLEMF
jgi:hypothetical protein